jgi:hypothetical protein
MRAYRIGVAAALAAMGAIGAATASPCYVILDRNDAVVFRDAVPPFDLSDPKSQDRMALRQSGALLLIAEFDKCDPVGYISPTTGGTTATVDEIVMQLKPAISTSISDNAGTYVSSGGTATARGNAPAASAVRTVPGVKY